MLQRPPALLNGKRLMIRRPARSVGTKGFQMKFSGNTGRGPANHAITERPDWYRGSLPGLQGLSDGQMATTHPTLLPVTPVIPAARRA